MASGGVGGRRNAGRRVGGAGVDVVVAGEWMLEEEGAKRG